MPTYQQIFENNRKWVAEKKATNAEFFENLAKGQDPDYLYIGCSDSRVSAEEMMGLSPGDVFVHRNIANLVINTDFSVMSVINYAVEHLKVKHIVVCGHYFCGGVKAAMQAQDLGILNPWLRNIRDVYLMHKDELKAIPDDSRRYNRLIELNVEEQCINVLKTTSVQKALQKTGFPQVHGWIFDIKTGVLMDLDFDYRSKLEELREIYDLGLEK